jgi:hypothetical protein
MVQDPRRPKDNGKIGMPKVTAGMNRIPVMVKDKGGKGSKDDAKDLMLGTDEDDAEDQKILAKARKHFDTCASAESDNRVAGLEDLKFKAGDQWPASIAAQRNNDMRPCMTINKIPTFVNQVVNEQRNNRPTINVSPVGDKSDPEVAKMYRGLIRFFERQSHADVAYDTAFDSAASIGWGFWRVVTEYESPESMDQTLLIKRIRNTFSVYTDPTSQEPDTSDKRYAFITELIPRAEFEDVYPDADPMSWTESAAGDTYKNWIDEKSVRVAEYFVITYKIKDLVQLSNGHVGWKDDLSDDVKAAIASGKLEILAEREADVPTVMWYKLTAVEILERREWAGKWIPIIRVVGNEIDIEGKLKLSGIIRNAKDAQRSYNYSSTMEMETIALAPKAPFVGAEGQFEGHEDKWLSANTKSFPYLEYQPRSLNGQPLPPPQRQPPSMPAAGWESLKQSAAQDMMATTGIRFDSTKQERVTDESGRALRELRQTSDMGSFHYMDNLCRSLKHQGDIFIDLIPKVIDTKRMMTILREDGGEEQVILDPHAQKAYDQQPHPQTGKMQKIFNPTMGKYGVTVTIGPSFATKRIEAAESMMAFVRALPQTAAVVADLIAKNQDWPEAEQIASRLAKTIPPHLLTPDMKDITPQTQALLQSMDMQIKDLTMKLQQAAMALKDKEGDRAVSLEKIHLDFEAKVLGVVQKAEASFNAHVGAQLQELGQNVTGLVKQLSSGKVEDAAGQALNALHQSSQILPPPTQQQGMPTGPAPSAGMPSAAPPQAPMPPR